jgi:hypothetical protein
MAGTSRRVHVLIARPLIDVFAKRVSQLNIKAARLPFAISARQFSVYIRIFRNNLAILPNVDRRAVHARDLSSGPGSASQAATYTRGKAFRPLWCFTTNGHGPRSNNLAFVSEFSYIAQ